jgi:ribosomal protein L37AE/L43A
MRRFHNWSMEQNAASPAPLPVCPNCGASVRVTDEHHQLVIWVCDHCDTQGAYSVPTKPGTYVPTKRRQID